MALQGKRAGFDLIMVSKIEVEIEENNHTNPAAIRNSLTELRREFKAKSLNGDIPNRIISGSGSCVSRFRTVSMPATLHLPDP